MGVAFALAAALVVFDVALMERAGLDAASLMHSDRVSSLTGNGVTTKRIE